MSGSARPSSVTRTVSALDLFTLFALATITTLALVMRRDHASADGTERRLLIDIPEGELVLARRTTTPVAADRWREIRAAATRMAASLQAREPHDPRSLEVYALGPLVVRRNGAEMGGWGGPKAGARQALAVFAFLLDRAERGAHKDEFLELIWPDVEIERADFAFHRTLNGLRTVLSAPAPGLRSDLITVRDGTYRLNMGLVSWFDVDELEQHLLAIEAADDPAAMEPHLDAARRLYRGDYMDDCPFFGDSSQVEIRRQLLRDRYVSALRTVAEARERSGSRAAAGQLVREAMAISENLGVEESPGPRLVHPAA